MSTSLKSRYQKTQDNLTGSARRVWLAGLGTAATVEEETASVFHQMVDRGREVEDRGRTELDRARRRIDETVEEVNERVERTGRDLDRRVATVLHRFGVPTRREIATLTNRVEELTRQVQQLGAAATRSAVEGAAEQVTRKAYHVTTHDEGWQVIAEGASRATSVHGTKDEAVTAARELARNQEPSQVVVHRMDGTIQTNYTYELASD